MGEGGHAEVGKNGRSCGGYRYEKTLTAPKLVTKLYSRMEAYGNHFRCDNGSSARMVSDDCGVASILSAQGSSIGEVLG